MIRYGWKNMFQMHHSAAGSGPLQRPGGCVPGDGPAADSNSEVPQRICTGIRLPDSGNGREVWCWQPRTWTGSAGYPAGPRIQPRQAVRAIPPEDGPAQAQGAALWSEHDTAGMHGCGNRNGNTDILLRVRAILCPEAVHQLILIQDPAVQD